MQSLPNEADEFVKSRAVKTAVEAAVAADLCYSVQGKNGAPRGRQMSQGTNWPISNQMVNLSYRKMLYGR